MSNLGYVKVIEEKKGPSKTRYVDALRPDGERLMKTVFLGYTDKAVAGSRALFGLSMKKEYHNLHIPQLLDCKPVCIRRNPPGLKEQHFQALQILHCKYEQFSVIVINTSVPAEKCHFVADKIIELCVQSKVEKIVLLTTVRLDLQMSEEDIRPIYENFYNTHRLTKHPSLPADINISDPLLCLLIQMIQIERLPCNCLIAPGQKASRGCPNIYDGSEQAIEHFQKILSSWTYLKFDQDLSMSLIYKGDKSEDINMKAMMYV